MNGVLETAGLLDPDDPERHAEQRGIVMRAIDKIDRLGREGVESLLSIGRVDESGDFTKGAELNWQQQHHIMTYLAIREMTNNFAALDDMVGASLVGKQGVKELDAIDDLVRVNGYGSDRIVIDPSVVRGLGYYTGPVFEAELTFETVGDDGRPRQFGSVAGGGRYDDLVRRFTGEAVPATGISIGVDRLLAALGEKGRLLAEEPGPVVITVMDRERMADYQAMAAELRAAGLRAEVFLGGGNLARQLKYADQRRSPVAVIEGGDERARGVVQLKDLALGARLAAEITSREAWTAQPAQAEAPRRGLVAAVRAMLARSLDERGA
jgi:histidyl-tRNA synthetase